MTDEELIAHLRDSKGWPNLGYTAANRIDALVKERAAAIAEAKQQMLNECLVLSMEHDSRYGDGAESELTAEIRELKGKREQQMTDLQGYTDEDLLRELVRRNGVMDAPTSRTMHRHEVLIGIGRSNHCYITFGISDDIEALKGEQQ